MIATSREKKLSSAIIVRDADGMGTEQFAKYCLSHSILMADRDAVTTALELLARKVVKEELMNIEMEVNG